MTSRGPGFPPGEREGANRGPGFPPGEREGANRTVRTDEQHVPLGRALVVGAMALLVFGAGIVWAYRIQMREAGTIQATPAAIPEPIGKTDIGIVNQKLFGLDIRVETLRVTKRRRLERYGWVDREAGTIHIPIERAMEMIAAGEERE